MNFKQYFQMLTESDEEPDTSRKLGKNIKETGYQFNRVRIYRALLEKPNIAFKPMDYVTMSKKWAVEHADHVAAVEDQPAVVISVLAHSKDVFEAYNPGEYFYNGPEIAGQVVHRRDWTQDSGE